MNIAVLQTSFVANAPLRNAAHLLDLARQAGEQGASLCLAPELSLSGVLPRDLLRNHHFAHECRLAAQWLAQELGPHGPALLVGAPLPGSYLGGGQGAQPELALKPAEDNDHNALFNCAVLLERGKVSIIAAQKHLPAESSQDYARYFTPGGGSGCFALDGLCFTVMLGQDALAQARHWREVTPLEDGRAFLPPPLSGGPDLKGSRKASENPALGADEPAPGVLICLAAMPFFGQSGYLGTRALAEVAGHLDLPVVFVNAATSTGGVIFGGGSTLFCRTGVIQARAKAFAEDTLWLNVEREKGLTPLPGMSADTGRMTVRPIYEPGNTTLKSKDEAVFNALQWGLKRFFERNGFKRVFLGLSGGLDSALCAVVAATALGPDAVCGVLMPSPHTSQKSIDLALHLAKNLGITTRTLPISPLMSAFNKALSDVFADLPRGVAEENLQARIRGALLMAMANKLEGMVICPANKSELAVGYSTLYGDSVGALALLGDVYKTDVYALAEWYNRQAGRDVIPEGIITRPPTAELSPGQLDTDVLPPYPLLDDVLRQYIEEGRTAADIKVKGADGQLIAKIIKMIRCAEFKRHQSPPVLEVGTRPFGAEWRMPLEKD